MSAAMYRILADLVLLIHAAFVLFVVLGGLLVIGRPRIAPWHLAALAWGSVVIGFGWICPLTPLENMLRPLAGQEGYRGGFIDHYVAMLIYPPGLTRDIQVLLAVALIIGNAIVYGWVLRRRRRNKA